MKKIILGIIILILILPTQVLAFELDATMRGFITSPNKYTLGMIKDYRLRYCEEVYLEATRRREYTTYEEIVCGDIFEIKRQQELDYIRNVLEDRGASY